MWQLADWSFSVLLLLGVLGSSDSSWVYLNLHVDEGDWSADSVSSVLCMTDAVDDARFGRQNVFRDDLASRVSNDEPPFGSMGSSFVSTDCLIMATANPVRTVRRPDHTPNGIVRWKKR